MLPQPSLTLNISGLLNAIEIKILASLGIHFLDNLKFLVENEASHIFRRVDTSKDPLRSDDVWNMRLIRWPAHLYFHCLRQLSFSILCID